MLLKIYRHVLVRRLCAAFLLAACLGCISAQGPHKLPRSTPEAEGVSSEGILKFLEAAEKSQHEFHSFMLVRHGKVVSECWWPPYGPDLKHTLYSTSKSFTATAVGFAVTEKKLTVDDPVISFFPDDLPDTVSPNLRALKIKHLLSMSVGHEKDPTWSVNTKDNWVKAFLAVPIPFEPGTKFVYNSAATYMLSAIVQKITGEKVLDYLKPRLFDPLGIEGADWETCPKGINTGGWGLRVKTEDLAKFGQLFLQKGRWEGKQILPESWIEEASTAKIMQDPNAPEEKKAASDWLQGYCYQMWRSRHNSYRGDGAFGQFILVLPEKDAVVAITAETSNMQSELNLVWDVLSYMLSLNPGYELVDPDNVNLHRLQRVYDGLALPVPERKTSHLEKSISGKTYDCAVNDKALKAIAVSFENETCHLTLTTAAGAKFPIRFGAGTWARGETTRKGPYLVSNGKNNLEGLPPFKVAGAYTWQDDNQLVLTLRYIESPHTETIRCRFDGDKLLLDFEDRFNKPDKAKTITGTLRKE